VSPFVGRADALAQLLTASEGVLNARPTEGGSKHVSLVLVTGEAGMGKTSLLQRYAAELAERDARAVWGTCWGDDQAPALWPWTQVVRTVLDQDRDEDAITADLAVLVPERTSAGATAAGTAGGKAGTASGAGDEAGRLRVFDAVGRLFGRASSRRPTVVLLDDLQWSDRSTVDLMRFLVGMAYSRPPIIVGAYRPDELRGDVGAALAALSEIAQPVPLPGLSPAEVNELVTALAGEPAAARWGAIVSGRSQGHPFFARELTSLLASGGDVAGVPAAIRELVARRLARLTADCARLLEACAVAGPHAQPDVLADALGQDAARVAELVEEAVAGGVLTRTADADPAGAPARGVRFGHDLYRESIYASLAQTQRMDLHRRVGEALVRRHGRGATVFPAELARHFAASAAVTDTEPALVWARRAAASDEARFAYADAAGHLARARVATADVGLSLSDADLVDLLTAEADARLRAGDAATAHALLDTAWERAAASGDAERMGAVALGLDRIGARFAMPRGDLVGVLEQARDAAAGTGDADRGAGDGRSRPAAGTFSVARPAARSAARRASGRARPRPRRPGHAGQLPARPARQHLDARHGLRPGRHRARDHTAG
jgi:predicted ATPase